MAKSATPLESSEEVADGAKGYRALAKAVIANAMSEITGEASSRALRDVFIPKKRKSPKPWRGKKAAMVLLSITSEDFAKASTEQRREFNGLCAKAWKNASEEQREILIAYAKPPPPPRRDEFGLTPSDRRLFGRSYAALLDAIAFFARRTRAPHDRGRSLLSLWLCWTEYDPDALWDGVLGQLRRRFGEKNTAQLIREAKPFGLNDLVPFDEIPPWWFDLYREEARSWEAERSASRKRRGSSAVAREQSAG